ncbi:MAG: preprotein translocase subunit SecA [Ruminococcaceae bacterium]|nr:preprotein translocase subunit SecA [Oscillospiraceae bacterium]
MGLFNILFGDYSEREIKKITPLVDKIESLADAFKALTDAEMKSYTDKLKGDLKEGKTLDDILPEAFALVREADTRVLGKRPFRVQLMGGILLHQGRIAEMKTGEGKTLVATLPAYLNALTGNGVHIVTVNDYLARRDSEEMGKVYSFLGLTTGLIVHGQEHDEKKAQYACDITYATNNELGFDYLRDNMVVYKEDMVQRGHSFAIVDEVDSILIDEARTPLIISGRGEKSTELYDLADKCVRSFRKFVIKEIDAKADNDTIDADYIVDEKARTAVLTKSGIEKTERFFNIENLSDPENSNIYHHVNTAIKAHGVMQKDVEYIIKDGAVIIVDSFTGRLMPGRRYNDGLHQAIEAKERVDIQKESRTIATITFQNYFRMYKKLSGMTGTAMTEEDEFKQIYALDVVEVPTNMPMIRNDRNDVVYRSVRGKYLAIVSQIKECHEKGQPVLVGTVSIDKSELLSELLKRNGIKHNVLNAKQHAREAEIVAQAGRLGAVTISTNMAGRGTDIMLGGNPEFMAKNDMRKKGYDEEIINLAVGTADTDNEEILEARALFRELYEKHKEEIRPEAEKVREAGGLFILGTERHESRRIDNQLRGRSGRQGDPGESRFFLSLEDDLLRLFGSDKMMFIADKLKLPEDTPLDSRLLSGRIEGAQKRIEANNFARRKHVLTYDDVMNQQRKIIYEERATVLFNDNISDKIKNMIVESVSGAFATYFGSSDPKEYDFEGFRKHFRGILTDSKGFDYTEEELSAIDKDAWLEELTEKALAIYESKDALYAKIPEIRPDAMREMEKRILLTHVDRKWMDHLEAMDDIKEYVGLNSYAQRDPVAMYRIESSNLFDEMIHEIKEDTVKDILAHVPVVRIAKRAQVATPITAGFEGGGGNKSERRPATSKKVGRNDPCPCGSGKKYKKCCGAKESEG